VLATGDLFVTETQTRDRLAERAHLVDMEGYAVAFACQRKDVPVRLVKYVSDAADGGSMDWPTFVDACAVELGRWLQALLDRA
jgi:adenosylhomocysteine nucleosidase